MQPIDLPTMFVGPAGDLLAFRGDRSRRMLREDEGIMCPCVEAADKIVVDNLNLQ
jgi:hypothetical protein